MSRDRKYDQTIKRMRIPGVGFTNKLMIKYGTGLPHHAVKLRLLTHKCIVLREV